MLVPIDELKPGMEVARDIINLNDMVLLTAGTKLLPQHLRTLKMWGINAVHITSEEAAGASECPGKELPPELQQAAQARVNQRLKHVPANCPGGTIIRAIAVSRAAARIARGQKEKPGAGL